MSLSLSSSTENSVAKLISMHWLGKTETQISDLNFATKTKDGSDRTNRSNWDGRCGWWGGCGPGKTLPNIVSDHGTAESHYCATTNTGSGSDGAA